MTVTEPDNNQQIKFVSKIVKAGDERKVISVPASELAKIQNLAGKPIIVTLTPILT